MSKSLSTIIKSTLAVTALTVASSGAYAAGAVGLKSSTDWDMGMNHIMHAGASISASNQAADKQSFTSNPSLDSAAWGHFGEWYTFMTHDIATTTISVTATDTAAMSPGFTVWRTDGEFDGGTGGTGELSSQSKGTPHSFNQVGAVGQYGTYWMTDDSVATDGVLPATTQGASTNGILETMGYASDGAHQGANGWGEMVHSDGTKDGYAELTLTDLAAGWYLIFAGGADGTLAGSNININVSSVPVPAAVYLFGSALVGLFASSRRKHAVAQA
jgi:hypothetical protein